MQRWRRVGCSALVAVPALVFLTKVASIALQSIFDRPDVGAGVAATVTVGLFAALVMVFVWRKVRDPAGRRQPRTRWRPLQELRSLRASRLHSMRSRVLWLTARFRSKNGTRRKRSGWRSRLGGVEKRW